MAALLLPDWPASARVQAAVSLRAGGLSHGRYAGLNLGEHVGDAPEAVAGNRALLAQALQLERQPQWLQQVHGTRVVQLPSAEAEPTADACWTGQPGVSCAVMTADCLPVLFCDRSAQVVAAAHAGWRGLATGVLEATVAALPVPPGTLLAWVGPAIGSDAFEVGPDVPAAFLGADPGAAECFRAGRQPGKQHGDLAGLARRRLLAAGVGSVTLSGLCTHADPARFYSYRRDGVTGRFATLIRLSPG